jgi:hypothetical protein
MATIQIEDVVKGDTIVWLSQNKRHEDKVVGVNSFPDAKGNPYVYILHSGRYREVLVRNIIEVKKGTV